MTNGGKVHTKPRQARTMTYRHDDDKYEATVGEPRKVYRRRTGPRGGYIKNADWQGWGRQLAAPSRRSSTSDT
jgi:hypothetical protein